MNKLETPAKELQKARETYWHGVDILEAEGIASPEKQEEMLKNECNTIDKIYQEIEKLKPTTEQRRKYGI